MTIARWQRNLSIDITTISDTFSFCVTKKQCLRSGKYIDRSSRRKPCDPYHAIFSPSTSREPRLAIALHCQP